MRSSKYKYENVEICKLCHKNELRKKHTDFEDDFKIDSKINKKHIKKNLILKVIDTNTDIEANADINGWKKKATILFDGGDSVDKSSNDTRK